MSIRWKLLISYLVLIIFTTSLLGMLVSYNSNKAIFKEVNEKNIKVAELIQNTISVRSDLISKKVISDLHFAERLLKKSGYIHVNTDENMLTGDLSLPCLYAGINKINNNNSVVTDITESTGAICSILLFKDDKLVRISTNLVDNDKNAAGTYLNSDSDAYKNIKKGLTYYHKNKLFGNWYTIGYTPLLDENNNIIGALGLGYGQIDDNLEATINNTKIGQRGYVYIMNSQGDVLVHPTIKNSNIINYTFIKKIIENKNDQIEYEFNDVSKFAVYRYNNAEDLYVVVTTDNEDLKAPSEILVRTILLATLLIIILGSIIAYIVSNTLVKPINKLKNYMEIASAGDLSISSNINSQDEIGALSNSFNTMIKENKRLLDETVQYDKLKTEFIANMSHELRTPLNIIFSTAQLFSFCSNEKDNFIDHKKLNKYTSTIKQNCYRLLRLVNNLIDSTKIDSGYMEMNYKNVNLIEIIENISLSTAEYIEGKGRNLIFDTDCEEKFMCIDPEKMERIMLNLISNATKFTTEGDTIEISIQDKIDFVTITVKDSGMGIPDDKQSHIFERFKQVDPLLSRRHEGSGIGLSLVKSLVELHDGTISLKSQVGIGTEFIIDLPIKTANCSESTDVIPYNQNTNVEQFQIEFSDIYN